MNSLFANNDEERIKKLENQVNMLLEALASQQKQIDFLLNGGNIAQNPALQNPESQLRVALIVEDEKPTDNDSANLLAEYFGKKFPRAKFTVVKAKYDSKRHVLQDMTLDQLKSFTFGLLIYNMPGARADPNIKLLECIKNQVPQLVWLLTSLGCTANSPNAVNNSFGGGIYDYKNGSFVSQKSLLFYITWPSQGNPAKIFENSQNAHNLVILEQLLKEVEFYSKRG